MARPSEWELSVNAIVAIGSNYPEKLLAAAVVDHAIGEAVAHPDIERRNEARDWFTSDRSLGWISMICPRHVSQEQVQRMALQLIEARRQEWWQQRIAGL